jgi:hypothetical protein
MKYAAHNKKDRVSFKFKSFKELENDEFSDIKLDDFKKAQLSEFKNKELKDFKKILNNWKTDKTIENLRCRLNSDDVIKNTLKELDKIGLDGRLPLKLLKMIKYRS